MRDMVFVKILIGLLVVMAGLDVWQDILFLEDIKHLKELVSRECRGGNDEEK
jgi:hypothetical protein